MPQFENPEAQNEPEASVIARAKAGDADAITALWNRYGSQLLRYVASHWDDPLLAEDVCADVFVKTLERVSRYDDQGQPFSVWLYRIAYAHTVDVLGQSRQRPIRAEWDPLRAEWDPPRFGVRLLRHLPEEIREVIIGDLEEEFFTRFTPSEQIQANVWYNQQAFSSFWIYAVLERPKRIKWRVLGWFNEVFRRLT